MPPKDEFHPAVAMMIFCLQRRDWVRRHKLWYRIRAQAYANAHHIVMEMCRRIENTMTADELLMGRGGAMMHAGGGHCPRR